MKKLSALLPLITVGLLLSAVIGCSESPLPSSPAGTSDPARNANALSDGQVQLTARVQVVDQNRRLLMLEGCPDTVLANQNCQIVRYNGFEEAPIPFAEIHPGEGVEIQGFQNQYQLISASRIAVCQDSGVVRYAARVRTTDQARRMLTFFGQPDSVIANQNCQITRLNGNDEAPIPFSEVMPGDSVALYGERHQNRYVYALHLRDCTPGEGSYDVATRDTITAIDYVAGTFTVAGRTETITVDDETVIWTNIITYHDGDIDGPRGDSRQALGSGGNFYRNEQDTLLTFADLQVGAVIELRADQMDESTLYARIIKLAPECLSRCLVFSDYLTSVDADNRIVAFQTQPWVGLLCNGARVYDLEGALITLADLTAGDYVTIKGYPLEGDTLKISQLSLTIEP